MNKNKQIQFIEKLGNLMDSGISMEETLSIIINMEYSKKDKKTLEKIKENIIKGIPLSKSIVSSGIRSDPILISMISYGESSGLLSSSIKQAREILEKSKDIKKKIIGSLVYPSFIAIATILMTVFLVMYIFPKIIPLFISMNIKLPMITRLVKKIYEYTIHYGFYTTIFISIIIFLVFYFYKKSYSFRFHLHKVLISSPIVGEIMKKYCLSMNCKSIGILLDNGENLASILSKAKYLGILLPYSESWNMAYKSVLKGIPLSEFMRNEKTLFPNMTSDMLSIGERTGTLGNMCKSVARIYENEIDSFIRQFSSFIEPILMIFMGIVVGGIALSIILPIYEVTNHLSQ